MTITVSFNNQTKRYSPNVIYEVAKGTTGKLVFDLSGELVDDSVSTAEAAVKDVTAASPVITDNIVSVALTSFAETEQVKVKLTVTTTNGFDYVIVVIFRVVDYFDK